MVNQGLSVGSSVVSNPVVGGKFGTDTITTGSTVYYPFSSLRSGLPTTETAAGLYRVEKAATIDLLRVITSGAIGAGGTTTLAVTLMRGGAAQDLTVTVGPSTAADAVTSDTTNTVSVAAGDLLSWRLVTGAGLNYANNVIVSCRLR